MMNRVLFTLIVGGLASSAMAASAYDDQILADGPTLYLTMGSLAKVLWEPDLSGHGHKADRFPTRGLPRTRLPNGEGATVFDGQSQYMEVRSDAALSVPTTGVLTIEAWIRPDVLDFPRSEGDGYVHWAGKGEASQQEYALRMYSFNNTASPSRPNRISAYAFNLSGGLGSGSYFQDPVSTGAWIHVATVINTRATSGEYPTGYVKIFKDGVLRKTTALSQFDVTPGTGSAPLRIGTRDSRSFFKGAIGKFAVYSYELSEARLQKHGQVMRQSFRPPQGIDLGAIDWPLVTESGR